MRLIKLSLKQISLKRWRKCLKRMMHKAKADNYTENSYPPASEASREVANLTERKNLHTPVYVTGGRFDRTGPQGRLSPFPV